MDKILNLSKAQGPLLSCRRTRRNSSHIPWELGRFSWPVLSIHPVPGSALGTKTRKSRKSRFLPLRRSSKSNLGNKYLNKRRKDDGEQTFS